MSILKLKDSQGNWISVPTLKGDKGNGISSAILNDDYTLTLTFTDGTTYKTPSIRGEKGEKGEPATDMEIHICSANEYDAETRMPTIVNPNDKTFYLVPTEDGASPDLFTEWVYVNSAWEMFGSMKIDLSGYVKDTDLDEVEEKVEQNTEDLLKAFPVETASGSIASFEDGANGIPLQSLVVDINPVQDLHGQDAPYPAGGGSNLLPFEEVLTDGWTNTLNGLTATYSKGYIKVTGTNTSDTWTNIVVFSNAWASEQQVIHFSAGTYSMSTNLVIRCSVDGASYSNKATTFTANESVDVRGFYIAVSGGETVDWNIPLMFVKGTERPTTYAPYSNICPISGWTEVGVEQRGVNVWDEEWELGTYDMKSGEPVGFSKYFRSKNPIPVIPNTEYYFRTGDSTINGLYLLFYEADGTYITYTSMSGIVDFVYTMPTKCRQLRFVNIRTNTYDKATAPISINYPSTDHDYHPYTGRSIAIDLGQTVYGGKLDVLTGKLVVDMAMVDLGTLEWEYYQNGLFYATALGRVAKINGACVSDIYVNHPFSITAPINGYMFMAANGNRSVFRAVNTAYSDKTTFKTAMSGHQLVYELVTPIEIQLTPNQVNSLLGQNNIWADTGDSNVEYRADPDLYIQRKMPEVPVDDVQIDGQSIVTDGIANIPVVAPSGSTLGLVRPQVGLGTAIASNGGLAVVKANTSQIKTGANEYNPIVSLTQHQSVFYGLAKAAGADEKDSTLPVGQYTDNAKDSIQNMLGITPLIASHETDPFESAHMAGELFIINGKLYRAKTALTAGEYINEGTNVEVVNVTEVLDDYATKQEIENNIDIVKKNSSGSIVSFEDGTDGLPLKSLIVDINPVQDLHGQDAPYPAGGGKNKWDEEWELGIWDATGSKANNSNAIRSKGYIPVSPETEYYLYIGTRYTNGLIIRVLDSNKSFVSTITFNQSKAFTIPSGGAFIVFCTYSSNNITDYNNDIAINYPSTVTTYSPYENICPVSGWTEVDVEQSGKNLLNLKDGTYMVAGTTVDIQNGTLTVTGESRSGGRLVHLTDTFLLKAGTYKISHGSNTPTISLYLNRADNNAVVGNVLNDRITITEDVEVFAGINLQSATYTGQSITPQLELGSTATPYKPYTGCSITIDLGQTVYGGKLDVLSGELVVDRAMVDMGALNWTYLSTQMRFRSSALIDSLRPNNNDTITNIVSPIYATVTANQTAQANNNGCIGLAATGSVVVRDERYTDPTVFKTAMLGVQLCYELAEPIEIQLTPNQVNSLLGANNIFADTGDTHVEYFSQVDEDLVDYIKANLNSYAKKDLLNNYVDDIQINGTSIVENGIGNIPIASAEKIGAVKIYSANGIYIDNNHDLAINRATDSQAKNGGASYRPIVPINQHISTFYGLAKAAGHDEKDSTFEVGTYTDEAKTAIKQMLGVKDNYDSFIVNVEGTDPTITGQPSYRYNCGEVLSLTVTPPETGTIDFRFTSGSTPTVLTLPSTVKMPEWWVEVEANTIYEMCITDGVYCGVMSWAM